MKKHGRLAVLLLVTLVLLAGCSRGGGKNTLTLFMMNTQLTPDGFSKQIVSQLKDKLGPEVKVEFNNVDMYNAQKLMVEYAAGMNDIMILPKEDVLNYGKNGANYPLEDYFDQAQFPEGVFEGGVMRGEGDEEEMVQETHLFAIPVSKLRMFQDAGYAPDNLFLTISLAADSFDYSVEAIKAMME